MDEKHVHVWNQMELVCITWTDETQTVVRGYCEIVDTSANFELKA